MADLGALLIRLERRLMVVEKALKIYPASSDLIHPRSEKTAEDLKPPKAKKPRNRRV
jgi:hypothetical protein